MPVAASGGSIIQVAACIGLLVAGGAKYANANQPAGRVHAYCRPPTTAPRAASPVSPALSRTMNSAVARSVRSVRTPSSAAAMTAPASRTSPALRAIQRIAAVRSSARSCQASPDEAIIAPPR